MTATQTHCRNCGGPLYGEYCSDCGQREGRGDLGFSELAGEMIDEVVSWDSRIWRTLIPLLFRPGFLTAEFIAGRRARYVPPFRLYLIISFFLFLVVAVLAREADFVAVQGNTGKFSSVTLHRETSEAPSVPAGAEPKAAAAAIIGATAPDRAPARNINIGLADDDSPQWLKDLNQRLEDNALRAVENPAAFVQLLLEYLPQMMFLLLPVFALLLKFAYFFSPYHYLQHLVFSFHYHSFGYLLYIVSAVAEHWFIEIGIGGLAVIFFVLYLPLALRRTFGSSIGGACGKSVVILLLDGALLLAAFILVLLVTLAAM